MREILFRGKRKDNGEWFEGFYGKSGEKAYIIYDNDIAVSYVSMKEVIPETVGQYTGLSDKNGNKIFEGDILEFPDRFVVVFWHTHLGCWDSNFLKFTNKENGREDMSPLNWDCKSKVIGNIHDNPELLKGSDKNEHKYVN